MKLHSKNFLASHLPDINAVSTKINPSKAKGENSAAIKFDLQDGNLQSSHCMNRSDLEKLQESAEKSIPINIRLTKKQTEELIKKL